MNRLGNVQALRGIACLGVVLFHLRGWDNRFGMETPILDWFRFFGFAGVDLFFVISGFIITATNRRHLGSAAAVPNYLFRRLWRIYPPYWAAFAGSLLVGWATVGWPLYSQEWLDSYPYWLALLPADDNVPVGVSWTLTYEVMFYLVFGLLLLAPARLAAFALGGWGLAILGSMLLGQTFPEYGGRWLLSPFVLEFLAGCVIAELIHRGWTRGWAAALIGSVVVALAGITLVSALLPYPFEGEMSNHRLRVMIWGLPAALVVYAGVAAEQRGYARPPRWLLTLGDASYAIYLTHVPVMIVAVVVAMQIHRTKLMHGIWVLGTFAACLVIGIAWYRWVEKPLLSLANRKKTIPPPNVPIVEVPAVRRAA